MIDHRYANITLGSRKFKIFFPKQPMTPCSTTIAHDTSGKTKIIAKNGRPMCEQHCQRHQFYLRRKDRGNQQNRFKADPLNICTDFCSSYDWLRKTEEGGHPQFNHDGQSDTPAFLPRFQFYTEQDHSAYKSSLERIEARANIASFKQNANQENNTPNNDGVNNAESNPLCKEVVDEFMLILTSKNQQNIHTAINSQL